MIMLKTTRAIQAEIANIYEGINYLVKLLVKSNQIEKVYKAVKEELRILDEANAAFFQILQDHRESLVMLFLVVLPLAAIIVDSLLVFESLTILVPIISEFFKLCIAAVLVTVEIAISYFVISKLRNSSFPSTLTKMLPYAIILLLVAFSLVSIFTSVQGYNTKLDNRSLGSYIIGPVLFQIVLLIPSIMLHLLIIKFAEEIHEAIAYYYYRIRRYFLVRKLNRNKAGAENKYGKEFVVRVPKVVQHICSFRKNNPEIRERFEDAMPEDLIRAINMVMGREVFRKDDNHSSQNLNGRNER